MPLTLSCSIYGTEVFEVSEALRDMAIGFASKAKLNDSALAVAYRAKYKSISAYAAATAGPSVLKGDVATSDVYYSGTLLSEAVENVTKLYTNGSAVYCTVSMLPMPITVGHTDRGPDCTRGQCLAGSLAAFVLSQPDRLPPHHRHAHSVRL
jgi:hypothetical protein